MLFIKIVRGNQFLFKDFSYFAILDINLVFIFFVSVNLFSYCSNISLNNILIIWAPDDVMGITSSGNLPSLLVVRKFKSKLMDNFFNKSDLPISHIVCNISSGLNGCSSGASIISSIVGTTSDDDVKHILLFSNLTFLYVSLTITHCLAQNDKLGGIRLRSGQMFSLINCCCNSCECQKIIYSLRKFSNIVFHDLLIFTRIPTTIEYN